MYRKSNRRVPVWALALLAPVALAVVLAVALAVLSVVAWARHQPPATAAAPRTDPPPVADAQGCYAVEDLRRYFVGRTEDEVLDVLRPPLERGRVQTPAHGEQPAWWFWRPVHDPATGRRGPACIRLTVWEGRVDALYVQFPDPPEPLPQLPRPGGPGPGFRP
jgi:hypothetical protein